MKQFDYTPLSKKITVKELTDTIKEKPSQFLSLVGLLVMSMVIFIPMIFVAFFNGGIFAIATVLGIIFFLLIVGIFAYVYLSSVVKGLQLKNFAAANNIDFITPANAPYESYNGLIFNQGTLRTVAIGFRFNSETGFETANYQYSTGGERASLHAYGFIRIKLSRALPHIVLDSRSNDGILGSGSSLPAELSANQKLSLEGDFDKYFTLYTPASYESDALYLFTPDVMQFFINHLAKYDIEIIDDSLYLYKVGNFDYAKPGTFETLVEIVDKLHQEFNKQANNYSDHRLENIPASNATTSTTILDVAPEGQRLKNGRVSKIIGTIVVIVFIAVVLHFDLQGY